MKTKYYLTIGILLSATLIGQLSSAQSLKTVAESKGKLIGTIMSQNFLNSAPTYNHDGNNPNNIVRGEFNALVLENNMKMQYILPGNQPSNIHNLTVDQLEALLDKTPIDRFLAYTDWSDPAQGMGQLYDRGHAMIWYNQAPWWLNNNAPGWSTQQVYDFTEKYIKALVKATDNKISEWDVFNEAMSDDSNQVWRQGTWYRKVASGTYNGQNSSYQLFLEMCFRWAREAVGDQVMLIYNDYNIEQKGNFKSDNMYGVISTAVSNGAPINGVGFQSHFNVGVVNNSFMNDVVARIREIGQLGDDNDGLGGLKVHITELDIHGQNLSAQQVQDAYWQVVSKTLAEPNVDELLIWGISDKDSWITLSNSGYFAPYSGYLPWNSSWGKNAPGAYQGIVDGLSTLSNSTFPPAGLSINWGNHGVHGDGNSNPGTTLIEDGNYYLQKANDNQVLLRATAAGGNTHSNGAVGAEDAKWNFRHLGNNVFEIKSVLYDTKLEVPYGVTGPAELIATTTWSGSAAHTQWKLEAVGSNFILLPTHDPSVALDLYAAQPTVVHTWGKNTSNANQILSLASVGNSNTTNTEYKVRVKGIGGNATINLLVDGQNVSSWSVGSSYVTLTYDGVESGDVQVQFIDGSGIDAQLDWVEVNGDRRQAEDQSYNTTTWNGSCGAGSFSEMMHCTGEIGFGETWARKGNLTLAGSSNDIMLYPNPANDWIEFKGLTEGIAEINVFNTAGQTLFSETLNSHDTRSRLDISTLDKGLYMIRISQQGGFRQLKFIKQ